MSHRRRGRRAHRDCPIGRGGEAAGKVLGAGLTGNQIAGQFAFLKFMRLLEQLAALRTIEQRIKLLRLRQDLFRRDVEILSQRLVERSISLAQWEKAMATAIKDLHVTSAVIAKGGDWAAMTQADWGRVGAEIKKEYRYLHKFAESIAEKVAKGEDLTTALHARAKLYGESAAMDTFSRVLLAEAGAPLGEMPAWPGDFECNGRCGCSWSPPELTEQGWEITWTLDPAKEHCLGCEQAAFDWSPFVILL